MKERNLRPDQVAEKLNCSKRHVYRLIDNGDLEGCFRSGIRKGILIPESSVDSLIEKRKSNFGE